jgi:hypothetical protein
MTIEGTDAQAETPDQAEESGEIVAVGPGRRDAALGASGEAVAAAEGHEAAAGHPLTSAEYSVAFTPRNVAIGLGIVAGVVAFLVTRRRRSSGPGDD